jgi:glycosyltransferase involved in cell wall biosynthesis
LGSPGKRIVVLVENLSVPFDRRVWQQCQTLRHAGYTVSVICPQGEQYDRRPVETIDGIDIYRYPLRYSTGWAGYIREYATALWHEWRLIRRLTRTHRFDVIQACNPPDLLLLPALPQRLRGTKFIFDQHDLIPELYQSRFNRKRDCGYWLTMACERLTFTVADVVMSPNESYKNVALGRGRKAPEDVFVVRSAPDVSTFARSTGDESLKAGKKYLLAYLGVMGPQDGVDHALRALAALRKKRDDWHAIFVGAGDVFEQMKAYATELGLDGDVAFPGRLPNEDLIRVLSTADVCLAPDPLNPLNDVSTMNKILEYMACGAPIVSYDLVEARVSAGSAALYATPNDERAFASRLDQLLDDPTLRRQMSSEGKRRIANELSWKQSELALLDAYDRALRAKPPGRARKRVAIAPWDVSRARQQKVAK